MSAQRPITTLLICTTPRSGSTLLCEALAESGLAGRPAEYFPEHASAQDGDDQTPVRGPDIAALVAATSTANGVFASKLFWHQMPGFARATTAAAVRRSSARPAGLVSSMTQTLGRVRPIWLRRRNTTAQAISYYRAAATGAWTADAPGDEPPTPPPPFDPARIDRFRRLLESMNIAWATFFKEAGLSPLVLTYEELGEADLGRDVGLILDYAGVERPDRLVCPHRVKRQSDALSAAWESELRARPEVAEAAAFTRPFVLICDTPGAATETFAAALRATGLTGEPRPYFALDGTGRRSALEARFGSLAHGAYLEGLVNTTASPNGVAAAVLRASHLSILRRVAGAGFGAAAAAGMPLASLLAGFRLQPRRIALRWRSPHLQAAAMYLRRHGEGEPQVERRAFRACLEFAAGAARAWDKALADEAMPTLTVFQEDLEAFPSTVMNAILTFVTSTEHPLSEDASLQRDFTPERRLLARLEPPLSAPPDAPAVVAPSSEAADTGADSSAHGDDREPRLTAYLGLSDLTPPTLTPAAKTRAWMEVTPARYAYRCLPMVVANQAGWMVLATEDVVATWSGAEGAEAVTVHDGRGGAVRSARTTFGAGVLTFLLPYLFRTSPGVNLLLRGPSNLPRDAIQALEGIVETDESEALITMNWKFTRPDTEVWFRQGEPIAMLVPTPRGHLEAFRPEHALIDADPELRARQARWALGRAEFKAELATSAPAAGGARADWQKTYMQGRRSDGRRFSEHQTSLRLHPFKDIPSSD